jgi:lipoyl(octanoyl) transferase
LLFGRQFFKRVNIQNLLSQGPLPYTTMWERQKELVALRQAGEIPDTLLLLEHSPVISYGRTSNPAFRLLSDAEYQNRGIEVIASDRGGDVTYHGPGQLVGYPILHLGEGNRDIHAYVRFLEEVLIQTCAAFGVVANRVDWHAGVWVEDRYLAAIGVRISRWVTHHGFAFNITPQVYSGFETIVACGQTGYKVTTLSEEAGTPLTLANVAPVAAEISLRLMPF